MIVLLVLLLAVCPCLGFGGWALMNAGDDDDPQAGPTATAAPSSRPTEQPSASPKPSPSRTSGSAGIVKGDCVVNDGTADDAELREVKCAPGTYKVLLRIPFTTDGKQCETKAPKSTANYVHDNSIDALDYVLCLQKL
ncbi:hypothetical protein GSF22_33995 [Micromonospora echinofusca]|uniref:Secreted protein n=1 Tax=Micromonospora echinofusca TaxID=47858 RepID=A0ABS3W2F8_MICEH|nr:hypothetical protein [Micromonospora echinofusca]